MNWNYICLTIGLILTIISKILQFLFHSKLGDLIVIPAAIFFVLAILLSIPNYKHLLETNDYRHALFIAVLACTTVVCFQLMMILLVGNNNKTGLLFFVPFLASGILVAHRWWLLFLRK